MDPRTHFSLETRVRHDGYQIPALPYISCDMFAKLSSYLIFNSLTYKVRMLITSLPKNVLTISGDNVYHVLGTGFQYTTINIIIY